MKVTVIGTGYVGLVTGTCFAEMGHLVTCVDIDQAKVNKMTNGECPIFEPGLEPMMVENIKQKRLFFSTQYDSIKHSRVIFLAVGTPSSDDGRAELKYLFSAVDGIAPYLQDGAVVVVKSTVPVGTGNKVNEYLKSKTKAKFYVVNNPEFLKEGSAVEDFMKPERIIIGYKDVDALLVVEELYEPFNRQTNRIIRMSNISAELTKYAANCFLATKISFMNEMARLCDILGADVEEIRHGIASDSRIGAKFLYPGPGYGGSCFPKDVKALIHTSEELGYDLKIVKATEKVNKDQKIYIYEKMKKHFGHLKGKTFCFWGVAFKANTDDIRETPAIEMAKVLINDGAKVRFYDPIADENYETYMKSIGLDVLKITEKYEALKESDALVVLTEWKEFRAPDFDLIKSNLKSPIIFDGRNLYSGKRLKEQGFTYMGIGKK
jgi:UDPglucose 6-dehydrogenase